ncbi:MAG: hypothetical protein WDN49_19275 [Acetobacteraceae bacterium]
MKRLLGITLPIVLLSAAVAPARAEPGGCLKYGAAGAVAGHLAHHGVLGAVGGCATGMYVRHRYRKEERAKAALYDKEHPGTRGSYAQKAKAYDLEHSVMSNQGPGMPMTQGAAMQGPGVPSSQGPGMPPPRQP